METCHLPQAVGLLTVLVFAGISGASGDEASIGIRPAEKVVLELPKDGTQTIPVDTAPYIDDKGVVALLPGDKIIVEFEIIDSVPKNPKVVEKNIHPERTLELSMSHDPKLTMVTRKSGFTKKLTMKCRFLALGDKSMQPTHMDTLDNLPSFEGFDATTYFVQFYDFGLE